MPTLASVSCGNRYELLSTGQHEELFLQEIAVSRQIMDTVAGDYMLTDVFRFGHKGGDGAPELPMIPSFRFRPSLIAQQKLKSN